MTSKTFTDLSNSAAKDLLVVLFQKNQTVDSIRRCASNNNISFLHDDCPALAILNGLFERNKISQSLQCIPVSPPPLRRSLSTSNVRILNDVCVQRVILLGGGGEGEDYKKVDMWTPSTRAWSKCRKMQSTHGFFYIEAVSLKSEVYVVSGDNYASSGCMEKYNYLDDQWTACTSMPRKVMFVSAATVEDRIFVSGGIDQGNGDYSRDIYSYFKDQWTLLCQLGQARYGHASIYYRGKLWIVGGHFEGEETHSNSVEIMDISTNSISPGPPTSVSRIWPRLLLVEGQLYAVGGDTLASRGTPSIEVYDTTTTSWRVLTFFNAPRKLFSSVAVGTKIYIFGGKDESYCNITTFDVYDTHTGLWQCPYSDDNNTSDGALDYQNKTDYSIPREHFHGGQVVSVHLS